MAIPTALGRVVVLAALAASALAGPAGAQSPLPADEPVREVAHSTATVTIEGQVTATFAGDGIEGTTVMRPPGEARLEVKELVTRSARRFQVDLYGAGGSVAASAHTRVVRTAPDGARRGCSDARSEPFFVGFGLFAAPTIPLLGALQLPRCPGPVAADLAAAIPAARLPSGDLASGPRTLDLRAEVPLQAGALTGTISSTLVLRLTEVQTRRRTRRLDDVPRGARTSDIRVDSIAGAVGVDFAVAGDAPECAELDACGLTGSLSFSPVAGGEVAQGQLLRRGERLFGFVGLPRGALSARLQRPDGSTCTDTVTSGPPAFLELAGRRGGRVDVVLRGPLGRSRCGEPDLQAFAPRRSVLARGTTTRAALLRPRTTLRLTQGATDLTSQTGRARLRPDLTIAIRRVAAR